MRPILLVVILALAGCAGTRPAPVKAPVSASASAANSSGAKAAVHATKMVGKPYRYGGASPKGFDCSGLVQFSYGQAGVKVPRSTEEQLKASTPVRGSMQRGDLLFFDQEGKKKSHVGIYLGNGYFVHAPSSGKMVRTDSLDSKYWKKHLAEVRRL